MPGLRARDLRVAMAALLALVAGFAGRPATGAVFMTQREALDQAFPGARIERRTFGLEADEVRALEARAKVRIPSRLVTTYVAWNGDTLVGAAFFDSRTVRTMPAVLMVVVAPDTTVSRIDVLAFHEPPDYAPRSRWLARFTGRRLGNGLWPGRDIHALSGATLTARAVTESARLALALYERLVAPRLGRTGGSAP